MNPRLSVIVPVYNSARTLSCCIKSILSQNFQNFELILVDDGSSDLSSQICDKLAVEDNRIVVVHKQNEGVSAARNTGLVLAKGEWITFVDSDDEICEGFFDLIVKEKYADLIVCGYHTVNKEGNIDKIVKLEEAIFGNNELPSFFNKHIKDSVLTAPWCKFFRKCIIDNNHIVFRKNITSGEDTIFVAEYLQYVNSIHFCSLIGYKYYKPNEQFFALRYKVTPQSAVEYAILYWHLFHKLAKNPISEDVTCMGRFFSMEIFCLYNKKYRKDRYLWFENHELDLIRSNSKIGITKTIWYYMAKCLPYSIYSNILKFWTTKKMY